MTWHDVIGMIGDGVCHRGGGLSWKVEPCMNFFTNPSQVTDQNYSMYFPILFSFNILWTSNTKYNKLWNIHKISLIVTWLKAFHPVSFAMMMVMWWPLHQIKGDLTYHFFQALPWLMWGENFTLNDYLSRWPMWCHQLNFQANLSIFCKASKNWFGKSPFIWCRGLAFCGNGRHPVNFQIIIFWVMLVAWFTI